MHMCPAKNSENRLAAFSKNNVFTSLYLHNRHKYLNVCALVWIGNRQGEG